MLSPKNYIILFDGVCNLCNSSVQFVLKYDKKNRFLFTSLQSDAAKELLLQYKVNKKIIYDLNSIVLLKNDSVYVESDAILHIIKEFNYPLKIMYYFKYIPKIIRDFIYKIISKNRYKWFGKRDKCMMPSEAIKNKFI